MKRQTKPKSKFQKALKQYHKQSDRHVLVVETDLPYNSVLQVVRYSDKIRKAGNELVGTMKKRYDQLVRTKKYRKFLKAYNKTTDEDKKKTLAQELSTMQRKYNVTWDFCNKSMIQISKKYGIDAVFGLTKAQDVWQGVEKCLYGNGKTLHFSKHGDLPCIRATQPNRAIIMHVEDDKLCFKFQGMSFGICIKDRFQKDEVNAIISYLLYAKYIDKKAVHLFLDKGICISTYRPCFASLVLEKIRGKYRLYVHITIEGKAFPKYDKSGNLRHKFGKGVIGADIGTQTFAYTSDTEVGLKNLAERGNSIRVSERKERIIYRAMDRSRRAMNKENYNPDGTIKKGKKTWKKSKRYKQLQAMHEDLCRKNAINRHLAINEDINHLRSIGDVFVTEPKNASKLMKRVKNNTIDEKSQNKGKQKRKKRFGKSIKNRCPGYFQSFAEKKFTSTGGEYIEVPSKYRASQYDHTSDEYIKKKLSDRLYDLKDGTKVQRDWYSSFLLYCYDSETNDINKRKCKQKFNLCYKMEQALIKDIKERKLKIMNSGIKVA